jgi:SAM-dependent MidA family methyltransferase
MRFDRFMEAALFDPEKGYYSRRISAVGKGGDFTTTAMISPSLGKAVAAWASAALKETGCRHLIELGPGEGTLAAAVRKGLPWLQRLGVQVHLVERSEPLRAKQATLLKGGVCWHATIEEALQTCGGRACFYSNEFVDAFPARRFRREIEGWSELYLAPGIPTGELWKSEEELPVSSAFDPSHRPGQIVEVHESFHRWWLGWLPRWKAGRMLTIDYGAEATPLYYRRPGGTLRAYSLQQRLEGRAAYANPGRQDLTADVNFTDLATWPLGHAVVRKLESQRQFLQPFATPGNAADVYAIDPDGPGEAFRVIEHEAAACTRA